MKNIINKLISSQQIFKYKKLKLIYEDMALVIFLSEVHKVNVFTQNYLIKDNANSLPNLKTLATLPYLSSHAQSLLYARSPELWLLICKMDKINPEVLENIIENCVTTHAENVYLFGENASGLCLNILKNRTDVSKECKERMLERSNSI